MADAQPPGAEPEPNWKVAIHELGWMWPLHFISFGCAFFCLALFSLFCMRRVYRRSRKSLKRYFVTVCILLFFFSVARCLYLLLDPYASKAVVDLPPPVEALLAGAAYPFITSAFTLVFLSLLEAAKLQPFPQRIQNVRFLTPIILIHFIFVLTMDAVGAIFPDAIAAVVLCRVVFILWGVFLFVSYLYAGVTVLTKLLNFQEPGVMETTRFQSRKRRIHSWKKVTKVAKFTGAVAFLGLCLCLLQTYSLVRIYESPIFIATKRDPVEIWVWFGVVSCRCLIEFAMGCLMCSVVYLPSSPLDVKQRSLKAQKFTPKAFGRLSQRQFTGTVV